MSAAVRESWNSQTGFLLAAVGSAVGLGNMWRFSYLAAEHGGAAFMVLYLGFTVLVGLPILLAEFTIFLPEKGILFSESFKLVSDGLMSFVNNKLRFGAL